MVQDADTTHPQITQITDEMKPESTLDANPAYTADTVILFLDGAEKNKRGAG